MNTVTTVKIFIYSHINTYKQNIMKYFIALIFTFFSIYTVSAQDSQRCMEIVNIAVDAVNNHSVENLHEHLAPDFVCARPSGPIAIQVLAQIITQID